VVVATMLVVAGCRCCRRLLLALLRRPLMAVAHLWQRWWLARRRLAVIKVRVLRMAEMDGIAIRRSHSKVQTTAKRSEMQEHHVTSHTAESSVVVVVNEWPHWISRLQWRKRQRHPQHSPAQRQWSWYGALDPAPALPWAAPLRHLALGAVDTTRPDHPLTGGTNSP
jgi:hypothetical protein